MPAETLAILGVFSVLGVGVLSPVLIVRMIIKHRETMAGQRNRQEGAPGLVEEMRVLRGELAALRDTTTRCDLTFDAAIDRLESRMERMEAERRAAGNVSEEAAAAYLRRG